MKSIGMEGFSQPPLYHSCKDNYKKISIKCNKISKYRFVTQRANRKTYGVSNQIDLESFPAVLLCPSLKDHLRVHSCDKKNKIK